ncbi:hypothetical protein ENUP19_0181G0008 [Entamoeba nuttalli]|uniref:Hydrolase, carbon-nitrogen family protein n=2 Tax=Entamoeba nuttalli TaxID=412467 RepID=K2H8Z7_ENTNP|nr:hydrolase, carbon-nitrogen family protein [Entamoeba nuttalli P19]EKE39029.1 hydrolase, carbon-nitrogen family protein [Entamoeba nuttalli P19]|eukprot:XP_008858633.1 hydrolase, carbon-nitrogen family protein [Entamoeba nuttalli P19]
MPLKITVIQSDVLSTLEETLQHISCLIKNSEKSDLYLLPEAFTTGFDVDLPKIAHKEGGKQIVLWMTEMAQEMKAAIVGSIFVEDNNKYFNRMYFVDETGVIAHYNKTHLFKLMDCETSLTAGTEKVIVSWKGVNFLLCICNDIRFPAFLRNLKLEYDVILCSINCNDMFNHSIPLLCGGRACENLCYCVMANRVGTDHLNSKYLGNSCAFDCWANQLLKAEDKPVAVTFSIDKELLDKIHIKYPINQDFDMFQLTNPYRQVIYEKK